MSLIQCAICQNPTQAEKDSLCPLHPQRIMLPVEDFKQHDTFLGLVLDDKYELRKQLGKGGFGAVYEAIQRGQIRQKVAIKLLTQQQNDYLHLFIDEMTVISQLRSPYTVRYLDSGIHQTLNQPLPYMVMELLNGHTLAHHILNKGTFSPRQLAYFGKQLLYSLLEAHELGIIHRDLKPLNIMLVKIPGLGECMKVLDFGIAKLVDQESREATKNRIMGTPYYLAPEILLNQRITTQVDLFSVGVILFEAYMRKSPFLNEDLPGIEPYLRLRNDYKDGKKFIALPANTPNELQYFFQKALAVSIQDRFKNAAEMIDVLVDLERKLDLSYYEDDKKFTQQNPHSINIIPSLSSQPNAIPQAPNMPVITMHPQVQHQVQYQIPVQQPMHSAQSMQGHIQPQVPLQNPKSIQANLAVPKQVNTSNTHKYLTLDTPQSYDVKKGIDIPTFIYPLVIVLIFAVIGFTLYQQSQNIVECPVSYSQTLYAKTEQKTLDELLKIELGSSNTHEFPCEENEECENKTCKLPNFSIQTKEVSRNDYQQCVSSGYCTPIADRICLNQSLTPSQNCLSIKQAQQYCHYKGLDVPSFYAWTIALHTLNQPEHKIHESQLKDFFGGLDELVSTSDQRFARVKWNGSEVIKVEVDQQSGLGKDLGFRCVLGIEQ